MDLIYYYKLNPQLISIKKNKYMKLTDEQIRDVAEFATFRKFLLDNPTGIISLVSDTFDLFKVVTEYLPKLKDLIMSREGKLVIRPDSGDPVDILCGEKYDTENESYLDLGLPKYKGVIELLWDIFGGTVSSTGYKVLDSHIGAIYGDSINYDRAQRIFERLESKGFASTNVVLGVGSYSLAFVTRDTHGSAQKATYIEVNGIGIEIFKDPITDGGVKKSAKGLLQVYKDENNKICLKDQCTWEEERKGLLQIIFEDGQFYNETTLTKIREKLNN
jgi:nicotinamide phosphoribosyltransferase